MQRQVKSETKSAPEVSKSRKYRLSRAVPHFPASSILCTGFSHYIPRYRNPTTHFESATTRVRFRLVNLSGSPSRRDRSIKRKRLPFRPIGFVCRIAPKRTMDMTQRKTRLRQMAALSRAANKHTKADVAELRGVLDLIAAEKVIS